MKTPADFLKDVSELRTNCKRLLDAVVEDSQANQDTTLHPLWYNLDDALEFLDDAVKECGGEPED